MHTKLPNLTDLPHDLKIVRTYDRIQQAFPGSQTPAVVVVKAPNVDDAADADAPTRSSGERALATGELFSPFTVTVNPDRTVARIDFAIAGNGDNAASIAALHTLRDDGDPADRADASGRGGGGHGQSPPAPTTSTTRCERGCRTCSCSCSGSRSCCCC